MAFEQIEGRNPVLEALEREARTVRQVLIDEGATIDAKVQRIVDLAKARGAKLQRVPRQQLKALTKGRVHNGVVAMADPLPQFTVQSLIEHAFAQTDSPLLILADEVVYEQNLGAILRTAMGVGAQGLVIPNRRGVGLSPVVGRVSMGGIEEVPVVRAGILSALKRIRKSGFRILGADMGGDAYWDADFTGPVAVVLGGESKGLSDPIRKRCDAVVSVPLLMGLESLNVSVTAGVLLFERVRQMGDSPVVKAEATLKK